MGEMIKGSIGTCFFVIEIQRKYKEYERNVQEKRFGLILELGIVSKIRDMGKIVAENREYR